MTLVKLTLVFTHCLSLLLQSIFSIVLSHCCIYYYFSIWTTLNIFTLNSFRDRQYTINKTNWTKLPPQNITTNEYTILSQTHEQIAYHLNKYCTTTASEMYCAPLYMVGSMHTHISWAGKVKRRASEGTNCLARKKVECIGTDLPPFAAASDNSCIRGEFYATV